MNNFDKMLSVIEGDMLAEEFANISDKTSGIKRIILHAFSQGDKELNHSPRIKVSNIYGKYRSEDCFVIGVLDLEIKKGTPKITSKELEQVKEWIVVNRKQLIKYWKVGVEMPTDTFLASLKSI